MPSGYSVVTSTCKQWASNICHSPLNVIQSGQKAAGFINSSKMLDGT